ncbi:hypothetical protein E3P99_02367 [Wallemia hederae]|uniref:Histone-lysine N-methyltransferase, H3 lysine-79 specific n=1 Tax=Wallemia hederae TaxID=1540922 RepID=A0A4T0FJZ3_9BASI|nr:hypothetical protein E3P99_02367 [Wallemia hederae]
MFKNKKPGSASNVKVKTDTKTHKTPVAESAKMAQKKRSLETKPAQGRATEDQGTRVVEKAMNKSSWITDNHTAVKRDLFVTESSDDKSWAEKIVSSKQLVDLETKHYKPCEWCLSHRRCLIASDFDDLDAETVFPSIQLQMPGGVSEEYYLAVPKNKDNYSPIHDLMTTVTLMLDWFIPSSFSHIFGANIQLGEEFYTMYEGCIRRRIQRAFNRRDGKGFVDAVSDFNAEFNKITKDEHVRDYMISREGVPPELWMHICNQTYQRVIGPKVHDLRNYEAFSSNIYGEIMPSFVAHLAQRLKIGPQRSFIDLGAGVGNLVLQMSLATGCSSFGVEQMAIPAELAFLQLSEGRARSSLYGYKTGEMDFEAGDFCNSQKLTKKLANSWKGDVILINNSFSAELNERLSLLFLDLKDNVKIVSLKPFLPHNFRITDATVDSPLAILRMETGDYFPGSVSWTDKGGTYYIHTVDRSAVRNYLRMRY